MKSVYWLAAGTFAIGTEGFMIVPLLPKMANDFGVPISSVGALVTVFALVLALSSPVLTTLTARFDRRRLLISAMVAFGLANVVAWASTDYWSIMAARILLALAAGLYTPNANALAGALVPPASRGRALAIVNGGITIAIALGLPLGAFIGDHFGWRMTFLAVAAMSCIAIVGLLFGLKPGVSGAIAVPSLRTRFSVAGRRDVLASLFVTISWAAGAYTVWTYIAPYLDQTVGISGSAISWVVFLWGVSAAVGVFAGGYLTDRFGTRSVIFPALAILTVSFVVLALANIYLSQSHALLPVLLAVLVWGLTAWGFYPAQVARLIEIGGLPLAPVTVSLNASSMYLGFSLGAATGGLVLRQGSVADLGWVGALFEIAAMALVIIAVSVRRSIPIATN